MTKPYIEICMFYLLTALWAAGQVLAPYHGGIYYLATIAIALAPTMWFLHDSKHRGFFMPHIVQPAILVGWPIVVPIYVLATRKWRGLLLIFVHAFVTTVLNVGIFYATIYLLWDSGPFR